MEIEMEVKYIPEHQYVYNFYILRGFKLREYKVVCQTITKRGNRIPEVIEVVLGNKKKKVKLLLNVDNTRLNYNIL